MNEFERKRQALIARNRQALIDAGLDVAVAGLAALAPARKARAPRTPKGAVPAEPTRRSRRHDKAQEELVAEEESSEQQAGAEAADIDAEAKGMAPQQQRRGGGLSMEERLAELELGGLVEYVSGSAPAPGEAEGASGSGSDGGEGERGEPSPKRRRGAAAAAGVRGGPGQGEAPYCIFIVIGSRGGDYKHYQVRLSDGKRSCTCPDHRIRKRDCKHIRLAWQQLGIDEAHKADWQAALERTISSFSMADDEDIEKVHAAQRNRQEREAKAAAKAADEGQADQPAVEAPAAAAAAAAGGTPKGKAGTGKKAAGGKRKK